MADWRGVQAGLASGFEIGQRTGGKRSALGMVIKGVADRLRSQRETGEALGLLGETERIKKMYEPTPEYKPTTQAEALEFEGAKAGIKAQPEELFERDIKLKVSRGEGLTSEEMDYYNKFMVSSLLREPYETSPSSEAPLFETPKISFMKGLGQAFKEKPLGVLTPPSLRRKSVEPDKRNAYNALRSQGVSQQEAKRRLGL